MKLTSRERKLIIFAIFLAVIVSYISFIFKPFYSSYTTEKGKNGELSFELDTIHQSLLSIQSMNIYNTKMIDVIKSKDVFNVYMNNDEIELFLMSLAAEDGYNISGFMASNEPDIVDSQALKHEDIRLVVKYITLTLDGDINNLDDFLEKIEDNKWIELNGIRFFDNFNEEEPIITVDLICYFKDKFYEEIE